MKIPIKRTAGRISAAFVDIVSRLGSVDLQRLVDERLGILQYRDDKESGEAFLIERVLPFLFARDASITVIDVGLNEGDYSAAILSSLPTARVYGFEPNPPTFCRAIKRFEGDDRIQVHPQAISDSEGRLKLFDYGDRSGSVHASIYEKVLVEQHGSKATVGIEVNVTRLDQFAKTNMIENISLLKIDTEGHEYAALKGASRLLEEGCLWAIQFEFNEMNVISRTFLKDFRDLLPQYVFFRIRKDGLIPLATYDSRHEIFKFQNIFAVRQELAPSLQPFFITNPWG